jgi:hypothetical protein
MLVLTCLYAVLDDFQRYPLLPIALLHQWYMTVPRARLFQEGSESRVFGSQSSNFGRCIRP